MNEEALRREYQAQASAYDKRWARYLEKCCEPLLRKLKGVEGRVLDVGCGTGLFLSRLSRFSRGLFVGCDLTWGMLQVGKQRTSAHFVQARAEALPFADGAFSAVVSMSVLHYLSLPQRALREFARVLKPQGEIFVLDWCRNDWRTALLDAWHRRVDPAYGRACTKEELGELLSREGFQVQVVQTFRAGFFYGMLLAQARKKSRASEK